MLGRALLLTFTCKADERGHYRRSASEKLSAYIAAWLDSEESGNNSRVFQQQKSLWHQRTFLFLLQARSEKRERSVQVSVPPMSLSCSPARFSSILKSRNLFFSVLTIPTSQFLLSLPASLDIFPVALQRMEMQVAQALGCKMRRGTWFNFRPVEAQQPDPWVLSQR